VPRVLKGLGHHVIAVNDPHDGIELIEKNGQKFDLVISDYDMPAMRGTKLAGILHELPFVIVSGRDDSVTASMQHKNIVNVLRKPYDKKDLNRVLNSIFGRS